MENVSRKYELSVKWWLNEEWTGVLNINPDLLLLLQKYSVG
jgi:hypothetical protein